MDIFEKHVFVCISGKTCPNEGSLEVFDELRQQITDRGLKGRIRINKSGCFDQCGNGPMIVVYPESIWYAHVKPADVGQIVDDHLVGNQPVKDFYMMVVVELNDVFDNHLKICAGGRSPHDK